MSTNPSAFGAAAQAQPWQFTPEQNGGKGDAVMISDAAITSGLHTLTSPGGGFATAVTGQSVYVVGAGAGGADYLSTITAVGSPTSVTVSAAAGTTVSGNGCVFGTDNTTPIKSAQSARNSYAAAGANYGEVVYQPDGKYLVAGAATVGGATLGNAIFLDPVVSPITSRKQTLVDRGLQSDSAAGQHFSQDVPQATGATIICVRLDGTNDATYGPAAVFGGPFDGYGANGLFNNICRVIDSLTVLCPFNSTFSAWDFLGYAEVYVPDAAALTLAVVPSGQAWPQLLQGNITNEWTFGLRMPAVNNNDRCDVGYFTSYGFNVGFAPGEHSTWISTRTHYCGVGLQPYSGSNSDNAMLHAMHGIYSSAEQCGVALDISTADSDTVLMFLDVLDVESGTVLYDPDNKLTGGFAWTKAFTGPGYMNTQITGGANARITALINPSGPVSSPAAAPATTVAWPNYYYRDAWITVALSGGHTFTSLDIDSTAQPNAASAATYQFLLPSGHSYTPTYSAGTLTHTVTLL